MVYAIAWRMATKDALDASAAFQAETPPKRLIPRARETVNS